MKMRSEEKVFAIKGKLEDLKYYKHAHKNPGKVIGK